MLALTCQRHCRTKRTRGGDSHKSGPLSHRERCSRWGTSPEGPPMMRARARGCVHNVTVLLLSLMSHQCTQRASVFSKPEYINTSVYQVILRLWGGRRRVELLRAIFLFHIFRKEHRLIRVSNYVYTFIFRGLLKLFFLKQLFRYSYFRFSCWKKNPKLLALRQWQIFSSPLATDIKWFVCNGLEKNTSVCAGRDQHYYCAEIKVAHNRVRETGEETLSAQNNGNISPRSQAVLV